MSEYAKKKKKKKQLAEHSTIINILFFLLFVVGIGIPSGWLINYWWKSRQQITENEELPDIYLPIIEVKDGENAQFRENRRLRNYNEWTKKAVKLWLDNPKSGTPDTKRKVQELWNEILALPPIQIAITDDELKKLSEKEGYQLYRRLRKEKKRLVKIKDEINNKIALSKDEILEQSKIQENWERNELPNLKVNPGIKNRFNKLIQQTYQRFRREKLTPEERNWELGPLEIIEVMGRPSTPATRKSDIEYLKGKWGVKSVPANVIFDRFLGWNEKGEGGEKQKETLGHCKTEDESSIGYARDQDNFKWFIGCGSKENPFRIQKISLKEIYLFNRCQQAVNSSIWITEVEENINSYHKIGWDEMIETIVHELSHAMVGSLTFNYQPPTSKNKGGHGPLHDDFQQRIKDFMITTDEFKEFEKWWKEGR